MLLIGELGMEFSCGDIRCILNKSFNIVLFSDYTAVDKGEMHTIGFVVPVDYYSFVKTISRAFGLDTRVEEIFQFKSPADRDRLQGYASRQTRNVSPKYIQGLIVKRTPRKPLVKAEGEPAVRPV